MSQRRLPAEWEDQDGVLLAWPHGDTDWQPILEQVVPVYVELVRQISMRETAVVITTATAEVRNVLSRAGAVMENVRLYPVETNDTWARDFGPLVVMDSGKPHLLDFGFNGWGLKFAANHDNLATRRLHEAGAFGRHSLTTSGLILEGGSLECDGKGTILTTSACLLNSNRNPHLTRTEVEATLHDLLGTDRVLWLEYGYLAGDDTDSHIDTLARLCPNDTIVHVSCEDAADEHHAEIGKMCRELEDLKTREGTSYRLLPLPWPEAKHAPDGHRLPATYANFLIINDAVLVPTYRDKADAAALDVVGTAFPDREVIGIDCLPLIQQHGSLHCITMQLPRGVLA